MLRGSCVLRRGERGLCAERERELCAERERELCAEKGGEGPVC